MIAVEKPMQYSVFRVWLTGRGMEQLRWELTELLKPEDDVLFIPLCGECVSGICGTHQADEPPDWPEGTSGIEADSKSKF